MKVKLISLLGILLFFSLGLYAQNTKNKIKVHKVWISKMDKSKVIKGVLIEANDESLKIIDNQSEEIIVNASDIEIFKFRRKGKVGKGALIGACSGMALGGLIGLTGEDGWLMSKEEGAVFLGIGFATLGAPLGALFSAKPEIMAINGNIETYKSQLPTIQNYSLTRNEKE